MEEWRIRYVKTHLYGYQYRVEQKCVALWVITYWRGVGLCDTMDNAIDCLRFNSEWQRRYKPEHKVGSTLLTTTPVDGN